MCERLEQKPKLFLSFKTENDTSSILRDKSACVCLLEIGIPEVTGDKGVGTGMICDAPRALCTAGTSTARTAQHKTVSALTEFFPICLFHSIVNVYWVLLWKLYVLQYDHQLKNFEEFMTATQNVVVAVQTTASVETLEKVLAHTRCNSVVKESPESENLRKAF